MNEIINDLNKIRQERKITTQELAKKVGICTRQTIGTFLKGKTEIGATAFLALCEALNYDPVRKETKMNGMKTRLIVPVNMAVNHGQKPYKSGNVYIVEVSHIDGQKEDFKGQFTVIAPDAERAIRLFRIMVENKNIVQNLSSGTMQYSVD